MRGPGLLHRHLLATFLPAFLLAACFFVFILELVDLFANLWKYMSLDVPLQQVLKVMMLYAPTCINWALPIALLFAVSYALGSLYATNELVAVFGMGIPLVRFTLPLVIMAALLSAGSFFFSDSVALPSYREKTRLVASLLSQNPSLSNSEVTVLSRKGRIVWHASFYDDAGKTLTDLSIFERDPGGAPIARTDCATGRWAEGHWTFSRVRRFALDSTVPKPASVIAAPAPAPELKAATGPAAKAAAAKASTVPASKAAPSKAAASKAAASQAAASQAAASQAAGATDPKPQSAANDGKAASQTDRGIKAMGIMNTLSAVNQAVPVAVMDIAAMALAGPEAEGIWKETDYGSWTNPDFDEAPESFRNQNFDLGELSTAELGERARFQKEAGLSWKATEAERLRRMAFAFTPLIVVLLSSSIGGRYRKNVLLMSLLVSLVVATGYYVFQMVTMLLAKTGVLEPAIGAWAPVAVFALLSLALYRMART
ncbi:MAG: LptF/LptG family permease [Rectinemataceae bacterium]